MSRADEPDRDLQHAHSLQRQKEMLDARRRVEEGDEPWLEEAGVQSVVDAVRDVQFPATIDQIMERVGGRDVRTSRDVALPLAYVLPKIDVPDFASIRDFETCVLDRWAGIEELEKPPSQGEDLFDSFPPGADTS